MIWPGMRAWRCGRRECVTDGTCVICWMQRAQRALDNPALNVAIEAGNLLGKPVVAFIGVVPFYPNANLRSYTFFVQGLPDTREGLRQRNVGLVLRRWPEQRLDQFCAQVRPSLVVGDENPMREPEHWRAELADRLRVPFWTVDADVVVPSTLLLKEQYAARTIRPRIRALLDEFLVPIENPKARVRWKPSNKLESLSVDADLLAGFPIDTRFSPFRISAAEAARRWSRSHVFCATAWQVTQPGAISPIWTAPAGYRLISTSATSGRTPWRWPSRAQTRHVRIEKHSWKS